MHPTDYAACQALARQARNAGLQLIRYASVRDPASGGCTALLSHTGFAADKPSANESWTLVVTREHAIWRQTSVFENQAFEFSAAAWRAAA
jgi:hypothetical protein